MSRRKAQGKRRAQHFSIVQKRHETRTTYLHTCPDCGKRCFVSRAAAKVNARQANPDIPAHVYKCGDYFHFTTVSAARNAYLRSRNIPGYAPVNDRVSNDWDGYSG